MPELRKDYVTDTWVVFSTIRRKRPREALASASRTPAEKCPICYGHEHMTPNLVQANLYPRYPCEVLLVPSQDFVLTVG